jgi:hypothetical protein
MVHFKLSFFFRQAEYFLKKGKNEVYVLIFFVTETFIKFALIQNAIHGFICTKAALEHLNLALRMCPNSLGPDSSLQ